MRMRIGLALLVAVLLTQLTVAATGRLSGVITDAGGAVLPGVTVTATGPQRASTVTDERGRYTFIALQTGRYTVTAELAGFTTVQTDVDITNGSAVTWSPTIEVAALTETVTVTGESPRGRRGRRSAAQIPRPIAQESTVRRGGVQEHRARVTRRLPRTRSAALPRSRYPRFRLTWTRHPTPTCAGS